jgi:hypothetical protein
MPDYQKGKVYCIRCNETNDVYVGSTTLKLGLRMSQHRSDYKTRHTASNRSSFEILQYPNAYIKLIELFPCDTKEQLNKREGEMIRSMDCVNKRIEGQTPKEYYDTHRDQKKVYAEIHSEKIKAYQKQYKETHKPTPEKTSEYNRRAYKKKTLQEISQSEQH